ncbi:MAG: hypothetical protein JW807_04425 [Spirochaetes bacterium]|nr:hypothetical protein [Spirochaetota bacterium]
MRKSALKKSEVITLSIASALTLAALTANLLLRVSPLHIVLPLIGAGAYCALVALNELHPRIPCDYIQTGEAAVGALVLLGALMFSENRIAITGALLTAILLYGAYLSGVLAPDKKEHSINGALAQGAVAVIIIFLTAGAGRELSSLEPILLGRLPAAWGGSALPAAAAAVVVLLFCIARLAGNKLRMYSHGIPFFAGSRMAWAGIGALMIAARGLLISITILFAGITCGIGVSVNRLYRGRLSAAVNLLAIAGFTQVSVFTAALAGFWYAAGLSFIGSYILFAVYYNKRTHLYDRHQKP